jgi:hypothetical protein
MILVRRRFGSSFKTLYLHFTSFDHLFNFSLSLSLSLSHTHTHTHTLALNGLHITIYLRHLGLFFGMDAWIFLLLCETWNHVLHSHFTMAFEGWKLS